MPRGATCPSVQKQAQRAGSLGRCQRRELLAAAGDPAVGYGTDSAATLAQRGFCISDHTSASLGPDRPVEAPRTASTRRRLYRIPGCQTAKAHSTAQRKRRLSAMVYQCPCQYLAPGPGSVSPPRWSRRQQPSRSGADRGDIPAALPGESPDPAAPPRRTRRQRSTASWGQPGRRTQPGARPVLAARGPSPAQQQPGGPGRAAGPGLHPRGSSSGGAPDGGGRAGAGAGRGLAPPRPPAAAAPAALAAAPRAAARPPHSLPGTAGPAHLRRQRPKPGAVRRSRPRQSPRPEPRGRLGPVQQGHLSCQTAVAGGSSHRTPMPVPRSYRAACPLRSVPSAAGPVCRRRRVTPRGARSARPGAGPGPGRGGRGGRRGRLFTPRSCQRRPAPPRRPSHRPRAAPSARHGPAAALPGAAGCRHRRPPLPSRAAAPGPARTPGNPSVPPARGTARIGAVPRRQYRARPRALHGLSCSRAWGCPCHPGGSCASPGRKPRSAL